MKRAFVYLLVCSTWGALGVAHAEAPPSLAQSLSPEARERYDEGRRHFQEGDHERALASFEEAYATAKDPRLLWNMAACARKLGKNGRAVLLLQDYLLAPPGVLTKKEEEEARASLVALRALVAQVTFRTTPAEVDVVIDGRRIGTTPLPSRLYLDQGRRHLRFARRGYEAEEREEDVRGGTDLVLTVKLRELEPAPPPQSAPIVASPRPLREVPARSKESRTDWVPPTIAIGVGAVAAGLGALFVVDAHADYMDLRGRCAPACPLDDVDPARQRMTVGNALLIGGGVASLVGVTWLLLLRPKPVPVGSRALAPRAVVSW